MGQITPGFIWSGSSPGNLVNAQNLNAYVNNAFINPTLYTGQQAQTTMATGDQLLLVNPTGGTGGTPAFYTIAQQLAITAGVARGGASQLTVACSDAAAVGVTYASATLRTAIGPGQSAIFGAGSVAISPLTLSQVVNGRDYAGAVAVSTWHYVYLISDGTNVYGLASQSATSPTLPSGITYFCLVSVFKTTATSTIHNFSQIGNEYTYLNLSPVGSAVATWDPKTGGTVMDGTTGSGCGITAAFVFQTIDISGAVPSMASRVRALFGAQSLTTTDSFVFGGNVQGTGTTSFVFSTTGGLHIFYALPNGAALIFGYGQAVVLDIAIMQVGQIWWSCSVAKATHSDRIMRVLGFTLSL